jgi:hypothetical protein
VAAPPLSPRTVISMKNDWKRIFSFD